MRAVFYARVSTEEESQINALTAQVKELEDFIISQGWILVDRYIDEGKSGTTTRQRDEYNLLLNDMTEDKFDVIVAKDQDRLQRKTRDWYLFIDRLVENKKKLYFYLEGKFYTADDGLITGIKAILAEEFSRNLSKKLLSATKRRQLAGGKITGGKIHGYDIVDGKLHINEEKAVMIRMIFNSYCAGEGVRHIQTKITQLGFRNFSGNPLSFQTIERIIQNEKYMGINAFNKVHYDFDTKKAIQIPKDQWIIHEGQIPPIVTKEIWQQANEIYASRRIKTEQGNTFGLFKGQQPLSGKITCGRCGKHFWYNSGFTPKNGSPKTPIWQCGKYKRFGNNPIQGCMPNILYEHDLFPILRHLIFNVVCSKDFSKLLSTIKKELSAQECDHSLLELEKSKNKIIKRKEKLFELYSEDMISKIEFKQKNETFNSEINNIDNQLNELHKTEYIKQDNEQRMEQISLAIKTAVSSPEGITNEMLGSFIKEIIVNEDDSLDIILNGFMNDTYKATRHSKSEQYSLSVPDSGAYRTHTKKYCRVRYSIIM